VDLATGLQREVVTAQAPEKFSFPLALSPDGHTLAGIINVAGKEQLFRVGVDGSGYRKLNGARFENSNALSWSADGAQILVHATFQQASENHTLLVRVSQSGGNPEIIRSFLGCCGGFSLSGSRIAVTDTVTMSPEVWVLDGVSAFLKTAR